MHRILKGDQNLVVICLHEQQGHFVQIAPNEISTSHPDALKAVLLTPLPEGNWYRIVHFPDRRFRNPSKAFYSGYLYLNNSNRTLGCFDGQWGRLIQPTRANSVGIWPLAIF